MKRLAKILCVLAFGITALLALPAVASATTTANTWTWTNGTGTIQYKMWARITYGLNSNVAGTTADACKITLLEVKATKVKGGNIYVIGYGRAHSGGHDYTPSTDRYVSGISEHSFPGGIDSNGYACYHSFGSRANTSGVIYDLIPLGVNHWHAHDNCSTFCSAVGQDYADFRWEIRAGDDGHIIGNMGTIKNPVSLYALN
jgi:hypothetical protein